MDVDWWFVILLVVEQNRSAVQGSLVALVFTVLFCGLIRGTHDYWYS
jgi:hypothetical protein